MTSHDDILEPSKLQTEEGKSPLKTLRELLDWSQEEFARQLGVTVVTVSRWERGITPTTLTLSQVKALSRILKSVGLDIVDLPDNFGPIAAQPHKAEAS